MTAPDGTSVECTCVDSGPLGNWTVNVGPTGRGSPCLQNPNVNGLEYNPRCLERKFDPSFMENITYSHLTDTLLNYEEVPSPDGQQPSFFWRIESWPNGIHPIPHTVVGGLQNDIPASPTDPWFFFHHAALDRAWVVWQSIEWDVRSKALPGVEEYQGEREYREWTPAREITMDSVIELSDVFESVKVSEVMSPTGGRYCYRYD